MSHLTPLSNAKSEVRALWFADLLRGGGDFFTKFQPIADLATGKAIGYEGLLRAKANSASRPSAEMFPAARALSIERPFEKLAWLCVLDSADRLPSAARLFLNTNPRLLAEETEELALLWRGLEKCGLDPSRVVLDLVEVETVESLEGLSRGLEAARERGVAVALDDVTSPYKTIQYCEAFRPDWVKIDCAITRGIARDPRRRSILKFFGRLSRHFSFGLIAEGIESAADLDVCASAGVVAAQGYFIGRPALEPSNPQAAFQEWVTLRRTVGPPPEDAEENGNGAETEQQAS
jgi:EAL domain-containing protein (putative c-di-GMP-specific phosphodiesterase class I)